MEVLREPARVGQPNEAGTGASGFLLIWCAGQASPQRQAATPAVAPAWPERVAHRVGLAPPPDRRAERAPTHQRDRRSAQVPARASTAGAGWCTGARSRRPRRRARVPRTVSPTLLLSWAGARAGGTPFFRAAPRGPLASFGSGSRSLPRSVGSSPV